MLYTILRPAQGELSLRVKLYELSGKRYLPSFLRRNPPSQSSGTLMSLQEGIAEPRALAWGCNKPLLDEQPSGRSPDLPAEPPRHPNTYLCLLASSPRFASLPRSRTLPRTTGRGEGSRGEAGMFRRDIRVSDAERGRVPCRSKEHTASTHPTQPSPTTTSNPKIKPQTIRSGAFGAADGNRTRVSGLGSVRSTIELQPHLFQCIAPACPGRN